MNTGFHVHRAVPFLNHRFDCFFYEIDSLGPEKCDYSTKRENPDNADDGADDDGKPVAHDDAGGHQGYAEAGDGVGHGEWDADAQGHNQAEDADQVGEYPLGEDFHAGFDQSFGAGGPGKDGFDHAAHFFVADAFAAEGVRHPDCVAADGLLGGQDDEREGQHDIYAGRHRDGQRHRDGEDQEQKAEASLMQGFEQVVQGHPLAGYVLVQIIEYVGDAAHDFLQVQGLSYKVQESFSLATCILCLATYKADRYDPCLVCPLMKASSVRVWWNW